MLTTQILSCYNHLLATTLLYLSIGEPIRDIAYAPNSHTERNRQQFVASVLAADEINQDYYEILGVKKDATKQEIHKAFRQLARKYHPDKNKDKGAQDEFIKIFKAYETLSDEKKRKEYDERSSQPNHGSFNGHHGWHTNTMNGFDMNDFFKQYEDQLFKHAQNMHSHHQGHHDHYHNQHQHQHEHFMFNGVNLDDLFHDIDEDEFVSFDKVFNFASHSHNHYHNGDDNDGTFGDGASFFGSHFPSQIHDTLHHAQHHHNVHQSTKSKSGYSCQTVTKEVNGMMMTQTSCM